MPHVFLLVFKVLTPLGIQYSFIMINDLTNNLIKDFCYFAVNIKLGLGIT